MTDTKMLKTIGEYWVCAILARFGWAPALTRDAIERTDILAVGTHLADRPRIEVQVKAATGNVPLGKVAQQFAKSEHEWFAIVVVEPFPSALRTFVVPRDHVCAAVWIVWRDWITDPTVSPGKRNTPLERARIPWDIWEGYEDRWDLLGTPTTQVPVLLSRWCRDMAQDVRVGLPPGHPWNGDLPEW